MTVLGIVGNAIFSGQLPDALGGFLGSLGDAFSATALFVLGLNIVNKQANKKKANDVWIASFILIVLKTIQTMALLFLLWAAFMT